MEYEIKKSVVLILRAKKLKTIHTVNEKQIQPPHELQIVSYPDVEGFYLLYLDASGEVITDTYHETLEKAQDQAKWELNVLPSEWSDR